jgi:catalase
MYSARPNPPGRPGLGAFSALLAGAALALGSAAVTAADTGAATPPPKATPVTLVQALNKVSAGPHPGYRANHAKGVMVTGTFTPAATAPSLSKAPHFAKTVPVVVRFSDTTGVPNIPDASPDSSPHGIAIRFKLDGGASTDIVSISANSFPVSNPDDFQALLTAISQSGPDVPKPKPIDQFVGSHPTVAKFVTTPRPAPESFATLAFYGVNAFKFTNAQGVTKYARYQIMPVAGEHALTADQAAKADPNYLMDELPKRIAKGPVKFKLSAQVANDGDPTNDATQTWPADRKVVELGTISLTAVEPDQVAAQKAIMFNPLSLPAGIEPSADPILLIRPAAYAVSFAQRAGK